MSSVKNILMIVFFTGASFFFFSCGQQDWRCNCTFEDHQESVKIENKTLSDAKEVCDHLGDSLDLKHDYVCDLAKYHE